MKELVDQGVQSTLLIPTEPIVLHKTTRRVQEVNNKGLTIVGSTTAVHKTKSVWKQWSVLDSEDNKYIENKERVSTMK